MKRACALLLSMVCVRAAFAGEQLTVEELTRRASAIVVLERRLPARGSEQRSLTEVLKGELAEDVDSATWGNPCVPSRALLSRWLEGHPRHPGRETWKKILAEGQTRQLVFLVVRDGALVPTCETEVMLGHGFSAHPDFDKTRARVRELVAAQVPPPAPSSPTAPAVPPPPTTPAPAPAPPVDATVPVAGQGCW